MRNIDVFHPDIAQEKDFIIDEKFISQLGLVLSENVDGLYELDDALIDKHREWTEKGFSFKYPEKLLEFYPDIKIESPDRICRPTGDSTHFTTGGVQHIETILRKEGSLEKRIFAIAQPSVRSQYMDKVKNGTSTAFVSVSLESIDTNPAEFFDLSSKFIDLMINVGLNPQKIKFKIDNISDSWNNKELSQKAITIIYDDIEIGECIYIPSYPFIENKKVPVVDISFSIERLMWSIDKDFYLPEMKEIYSANKKKASMEHLISIVDCIRTSVLLAGEGIKPSHRDPGYRLRQLIKRFVERNRNVNIDIRELAVTSYNFWKSWNYNPDLSIEDIIQTLVQEKERSTNVFLLKEIERLGGQKIQMNVNQSTDDFLRQIYESFSAANKKILNQIIYDQENEQ
jgi:hypothetical protein